MTFSRIYALLAALFLIACIALASIVLMLNIGTSMRHSPGVEMEAGTIHGFDNTHGFYLKTDAGTIEHFACIERCLTAKPHMQRHKNENAHTNVYYIQMPNGDLYAVDVD